MCKFSCPPFFFHFQAVLFLVELVVIFRCFVTRQCELEEVCFEFAFVEYE